MISALVEKTTFAAGEVSKNLYARHNLARHQSGVARAENMVVLVEGGLTRRPGTRFQLALKDQSQRGRQVSFRFAAGDNYVLVFNGGVMRVKRDGGYVLDGSDPYELATPWLEADLAKMRAVSVGNALFVVCEGYKPRVITRVDHDDWTIADYQPTGGPVGDQNLDEDIIVSVSAAEGPVALAATADLFAAQHVGQIMRIDEGDLSVVPLWKANEAITLATETFTGNATIGNYLNSADAFDGVNDEYAAAPVGQNRFIGKTFNTPSSVQRVTIRAKIQYPTTFFIRGKTGSIAPTHPQDGKYLGQASRTPPVNEAGFWIATEFTIHIYTNDFTTAFNHIFVDTPETFAGTTVQIDMITFVRYAALTDIVLRRWNGNVYQLISTGTNVGAAPPVHTEGDIQAEAGGGIWRYLHSGHGYARITAVTDARTASGEVLSRMPDDLIENGSFRFSMPAWGDVDGWPDRIALHDGRLVFFRGNRAWITAPDDLFSLEEIAGNPDTAVSFRLRADDGSLPDVEWAFSGGALVLGLRDGEWVGRTASLYDPLTIDNFVVRPKKQEGSAAHVPCKVEGGAIIIGRSKKRLHFAQFDDDTSALDMDEITKAARHILRGLAQGVAFQRDPNRLVWVWCENGDLVSVTFDPKESVLGFCRQPMQNGYVEDVVSVPATNEQTTELHLIVRRVIGGETKRYTEILADFFDPLDEDAPTAEGAWFLDSALRYQGAAATLISGLDHLEGEEVYAHADGAMQGPFTVTGGQVTLKRAAADVIVGKKIPWKARSLPFDLNTQAGMSRDDQKRAPYVLLDLVDAAGGNVRVNDGPPEKILKTGAKKSGAPIALFSGRKRIGPLDCPADMTATVEVFGEDTMPFTLTGMSPDLEVLETD